MNIRVRYTPSFMDAMRVSLYINRRLALICVAVGIFLLIQDLALHLHGVFTIALGVLVIIEAPLVLLMKVWWNRSNLLQETEVTFTSEGIQRRTETQTLDMKWDRLTRFHESKHIWVFTSDRRTRISLKKQSLSPDQQLQLAHFIVALPQAGSLW
jgi:hypothetical protein